MEVYPNLNIPMRCFNNVCRVCLTASQLLISIHEINLTHNLNSLELVSHIPLTQVFQKYCGVMVSENDNKPQKICESCMNGLRQAYNIFQLFLHSNNLLDLKLDKHQLQQQQEENNALDDLSSDIMGIISKGSENNTSSPVAFVESLDTENADSDQNLIIIPNHNLESCNGPDLTNELDTHFINIDNDHQSDESKLKGLSDSKICISLDNNMDEGQVVCKKEPETNEPMFRSPPRFIDPVGLLRDHTYSVNERAFMRLLQGPRKKKRSPRPKKPKKPKIEKVPRVIVPRTRKRKKDEELENKMFKCRVCEIEFEGMEKIFDHLREKHWISNKCILCPKVLERYDFMIRHFVAFHLNHGMLCTRCLKYFKDKESLELHKASEDHKQLFPCKICNKEYLSHSRLKLHIEGMHNPEPKKFQCNKCGKMLRWKYNLYSHMMTHQDVATRRRYLCQFCAKSFVNGYDLKFHVKKVHEGQTHLRYKNPKSYSGTPRKELTMEKDPKANETLSMEEAQKRNETKIYACEFCARTFTLLHAFNRHSFSHPECKSVKCPYCPGLFDDPDSYRKHRAFAHKSFVCNICDKGFATKPMLTHHENGHNKRHKCDLCSMDFASKFSLKCHRRIHTGERPFQCKYCDKAFTQSSPLTQHIKSLHTEQKNHKCKICGKGFTSSSGLKIHMRSHTGEKPFACPYCAKRYRDTVSRHKHVKRDHPEQMEEFMTYKKRFQEKEVKEVSFGVH